MLGRPHFQHHHRLFALVGGPQAGPQLVARLEALDIGRDGGGCRVLGKIAQHIRRFEPGLVARGHPAAEAGTDRRAFNHGPPLKPALRDKTDPSTTVAGGQRKRLEGIFIGVRPDHPQAGPANGLDQTALEIDAFSANFAEAIADNQNVLNAAKRTGINHGNGEFRANLHNRQIHRIRHQIERRVNVHPITATATATATAPGIDVTNRTTEALIARLRECRSVDRSNDHDTTGMEKLRDFGSTELQRGIASAIALDNHLFPLLFYDAIFFGDCLI